MAIRLRSLVTWFQKLFLDVDLPIMKSVPKTSTLAPSSVSAKGNLRAGQAVSHRQRLEKLANRFESLEGRLSDLESRIEMELPQLGIDVTPLGRKRKPILAASSAAAANDDAPTIEPVEPAMGGPVKPMRSTERPSPSVGRKPR